MALGTISAVFFFSIDAMSLNDATCRRLLVSLRIRFKQTVEHSVTYEDGVSPPSEAHVVASQVQPAVVRKVRQI